MGVDARCRRHMSLGGFAGAPLQTARWAALFRNALLTSMRCVSERNFAWGWRESHTQPAYVLTKPRGHCFCCHAVFCSFKKMKENCNSEFTAHWTCLDNNNQDYWRCRKTQAPYDKCVLDKMVWVRVSLAVWWTPFSFPPHLVPCARFCVTVTAAKTQAPYDKCVLDTMVCMRVCLAVLWSRCLLPSSSSALCSCFVCHSHCCGARRGSLYSEYAFFAKDRWCERTASCVRFSHRRVCVSRIDVC